MKKKASPRAKSAATPPEAEQGPCREYPLLPMAGQIKSYDDICFAEKVRAPFNGDYAIKDAPNTGDGTGA